MKPGFQRTIPILTAMVLGALLPGMHGLSWLVRWLVIAMLFLVFLQTRLSRDVLQRSHLVLLATNFAIGLAAWGVGLFVGGRDLALAAFFCGITPTAIAAPVITGFLKGRVSYVAGAFLLSNLAVAASLPFILPWVLGHPTPEAFAQVTQSMGWLVFTPFGLAWLLRVVYPPAVEWPRRLGNVSFGAWVAAIFLITANASNFLRSQSGLSRTVVLEIALASLLICVLSFALGRLIGGREFAREASQSLGQKNTTFTIYLAMTYASPLVALGPTFYVIWHNLWNSWQLHQHANREALTKPADPAPSPP